VQKRGLRFDVGAAAGYALALACAAVQAAAIAPMRRYPEFSMAAGILAGVGIELLSLASAGSARSPPCWVTTPLSDAHFDHGPGE
jgi:hypothetical protein